MTKGNIEKAWEGIRGHMQSKQQLSTCWQDAFLVSVYFCASRKGLPNKLNREKVLTLSIYLLGDQRI